MGVTAYLNASPPCCALAVTAASSLGHFAAVWRMASWPNSLSAAGDAHLVFIGGLGSHALLEVVWCPPHIQRGLGRKQRRAQPPRRRKQSLGDFQALAVGLTWRYIPTSPRQPLGNGRWVVDHLVLAARLQPTCLLQQTMSSAVSSQRTEAGAQRWVAHFGSFDTLHCDIQHFGEDKYFFPLWLRNVILSLQKELILDCWRLGLRASLLSPQAIANIVNPPLSRNTFDIKSRERHESQRAQSGKTVIIRLWRSIQGFLCIFLFMAIGLKAGITMDLPQHLHYLLSC